MSEPCSVEPHTGKASQRMVGIEDFLTDIIDTTKLAEDIKRVAQKAENEEELRIGFEKVFDPILNFLGVEPRHDRSPNINFRAKAGESEFYNHRFRNPITR